MRPRKSNDRRVRRTRRALRQAIVDLTLEKGFGSLTVSEIADTAGLRRATFYLHYESVEALLADTLADSFEDVLPAQDDATLQADLLALCGHLRAQRVLYTRLHATTGWALMRDSLTVILRERGQLRDDVSPVFVAGGATEMLLGWIANGYEHSQKAVVDSVIQLCEQLA